MDSKAIEGGCFCGAIRYVVDAKPLGSMICHCKTCRKIAGAMVVPWLTFPLDQFRITRGQPTKFESSPGVHRMHCAACSTTLTYSGPKFPDEVDVVTTTLDDPNAFPPTHHSWVSHDLKWTKFGDGLPQYPESRTG
ncbi:MAG TPA: GFA family protein [Steroidobacteraceae bacterium]|nr:GFA family protein [Steroidobacteraceae bacterium]